MDNNQANARQDPAYQEGLAHLQVGEWREAIRCFEELARKHPDSQIARRLLDEAQFKADLDANTRVRAKRWVFGWRQIVIPILILLGTAYLGYRGYELLKGPVQQVMAVAQERSNLLQLRADCRSRFLRR